MGNSHWVGLVFEYNSTGDLIKANYYDSGKGAIKKAPDYLNSILKSHHKKSADIQQFTVINDEKLIRQNNGSDCGPCTIGNLLLAVGYSEKNPDPIQRRASHIKLLNNDFSDQNFNKRFYQRQKHNIPSFVSVTREQKHFKSQNYHISLSEYKGLLHMALVLLNLPEKILLELKTAIQPTSNVNPFEEHTTFLNQIRSVLQKGVQEKDESIRKIASNFFCLGTDEILLNDSPLKLDYNQIPLLIILVNLQKETVESSITNLNSIEKDISSGKMDEILLEPTDLFKENPNDAMNVSIEQNVGSFQNQEEFGTQTSQKRKQKEFLTDEFSLNNLESKKKKQKNESQKPEEKVNLEVALKKLQEELGVKDKPKDEKLLKETIEDEAIEFEQEVDIGEEENEENEEDFSDPSALQENFGITFLRNMENEKKKKEQEKKKESKNKEQQPPNEFS